MLHIIYMDDYPEDEDAERVSGKTMMLDSDAAFFLLTQGYDLNRDDFFIKIVDYIDQCDLIADGVLYRRPSKTTHSVERVSGGVKTVWLMYHHYQEYIFPSSFLGENCYQPAFWAAEDRDIWVYDDSSMMFAEDDGYCMQNCHGKFYDFHKKKIIDLDAPGFDCIEYFDWR